MLSEVRAWTETDSFYHNRSALSFYVYKLSAQSMSHGDGKKGNLALGTS